MKSRSIFHNAALPRFIVVVAFICGTVFSALQADASGGGGFVPGTSSAAGFNGAKANANLVTVEKAKSLPDDAMILLRGNIVNHQGGNKYEFRDESGSITVEIKDKRWEGQKVSPTDTVELFGEVDKGRKGVSIEVKRLVKK